MSSATVASGIVDWNPRTANRPTSKHYPLQVKLDIRKRRREDGFPRLSAAKSGHN